MPATSQYLNTTFDLAAAVGREAARTNDKMRLLMLDRLWKHMKAEAQDRALDAFCREAYGTATLTKTA